MTIKWYYADARNQQQGPVDATTLAAEVGRGALTGTSLVWHDGLSGWVPLASVARELGLSMPPPMPSPRAPAVGGRVAAPARSGSSGLLIVLLVLGGLVMVVAILAAIALPAYQDYVQRAKVAQAAMTADDLKLPVAEAHLSEGHCPRSGEGSIPEASHYRKPPVAAIDVGTDRTTGACTIEVRFDDSVRALSGRSIVYSLRPEGTWESTSDVPARLLPRSLRSPD